MQQALKGADTLFWLSPNDTSKTLDQSFLEFTRPVADAVRTSGVQRVVSITSMGRNTCWQDRSGLVTASIAMDDMLVATGVAYRGLAIPSFMENIARQAGTMKEKSVFLVQQLILIRRCLGLQLKIWLRPQSDCL